MSKPRTYVIGLPVVVTVDGDKVSVSVDLAEVADLSACDESEHRGADAQVIATARRDGRIAVDGS